MTIVYLLAAVVALGVAVLLQRSEPVPRLWAILSWVVAVVFVILFVPELLRAPTIETVSAVALLASLPLIAVPFQVRMLRLIGESRRGGTSSRGDAAPARGPGGGRVRTRDRRR